MARSTTLQLINKVLKNCGLATTTSLSSMTTSQIVCFDALNEAIQEISNTEPLNIYEKAYSLTMSSATRSIAQPGSMLDFNKESFYNEESDKEMGFLAWENYFREHSDPTVASENKGQPASISYFREKFYVTPQPNANSHGSKIFFKGWEVPRLLATAATGGATCRMPEDFEETLLVNLATYKAMHYFGMAEASLYYNKVFGIEGDPQQEGSLAKFIRRYRSSDLQPKFSYVL